MNVKGVLFVDYVRMIRGRKDVDWSRYLHENAIAWVNRPVDPAGWYPMAVFEVLGNAILDVFGERAFVEAGEVSPPIVSDLELARLWGAQSVELLIANNPLLWAVGDPVETFNRMRVLRSTYFDFEALQFPMLLDDEVLIVIDYRMGARAEEAAAHQTLGFFQTLLDKTGATEIVATFTEQKWNGAPRTALSLRWTPPS